MKAAAQPEIARDSVQDLVRRSVPGARELRLAECVKIASGVSHSTYVLKTVRPENHACLEFVLRIAPPASVQPALDVRSQYMLLKALQESGIPVPAVYGLDSGGALGRPCFLMEKVDGDNFVTWKSVEQRCGFATLRALRSQFIQTLTAIHALDWKSMGLSFLGVPGDCHEYALAELQHWRAKLTSKDEREHPLLLNAVLWLKRRAPRCRHPLNLLHGDYRLINTIVRGGEIVSVLDWEVAAIGDPVADLGMLAMEIWGGGFLSRDELLHEYALRTGVEATPEELRYWEVVGYFKTIAATFGFIHAFRHKQVHDLRVALSAFKLTTFFEHLAELLAA